MTNHKLQITNKFQMKNKKLLFWIPIFIGMTMVGIILLFVFGNKTTPQTANKKKILVTASFYPIAYLAEQVGGERVEVINLTPPGVEPHDFEPTTKDIALLQKSKLLLMNGGGVEVYEEKIKQMLIGSHVKVVAVGAPFADGTIVQGGVKRIDPHTWIDPVIFGKMAEKVAEELGNLDTVHVEEYTKRAETLVQKKLNANDAEYKKSLANCNLNKIVTAHTAFGYIARRYGFEQIGITGLSPEEEPSPKELAAITTMMQKEGVQHILLEELAPRIWGETVAAETGAKILALSPLEGISDEEKKEGVNYISMQRSNIKTLQTAMQCK